MEAVSQVILRNSEALSPGPLLLVDPPRDGLFRELDSAGHSVTISTSDFGDGAWLRAAGANTAFEAAPSVSAQTTTVIAALPREKERLDMLLHRVASGLPPNGAFWLVGPKRAGIKSAPRYLERRFGTVNKRDSARHCQLFEARAPLPAPSFSLDDYEREWEPGCDDGLSLVSLPGVFAHGRLDEGTARLLPLLGQLEPAGRVLDFACGSGVIGLCLLRLCPGAELTLLDNSALALEAARRSLARNGMQARLLPSDGLSRLEGRFEWIVSNPPFHKGVANTLDVADRFFRDAGTFLAENGKILVVFNRHLPYLGWLRKRFARVDVLDDETAYLVVCAAGPR
jgi:16S rRNA (guanine1207-N2)-methyltransferase